MAAIHVVMTHQEYKQLCETILQQRYGLTLNDAGIEDEDLHRAQNHDDDSPEEYIERIARKYDLDLIDTL